MGLQRSRTRRSSDLHKGDTNHSSRYPELQKTILYLAVSTTLSIVDIKVCFPADDSDVDLSGLHTQPPQGYYMPPASLQPYPKIACATVVKRLIGSTPRLELPAFWSTCRSGPIFNCLFWPSMLFLDSSHVTASSN